MVFCEKDKNSIAEIKDFRTFYQDTVKGLHGYLHKFGISNQQDVEEIIQETYIEAFKSYEKLEKPEAAKSWLYTIARRQFIRYLEVKRKNPRANDAQNEEALLRVRSSETPADQSIYAAYICKQVVDHLEKVENMTRCRALTRYFVELESLNEISKALDVKVSTLTTWCNRFRNELKEKIDELNARAGSSGEVRWRKLFRRARVAA